MLKGRLYLRTCIARGVGASYRGQSWSDQGDHATELCLNELGSESSFTT